VRRMSNVPLQFAINFSLPACVCVSERVGMLAHVRFMLLFSVHISAFSTRLYLVFGFSTQTSKRMCHDWSALTMTSPTLSDYCMDEFLCREITFKQPSNIDMWTF
jgi:hypothetical protein